MRKLTPDILDEALRLIDGGLSVKRAASNLDVSWRTLYDHVLGYRKGPPDTRLVRAIARQRTLLWRMRHVRRELASVNDELKSLGYREPKSDRLTFLPVSES